MIVAIDGPAGSGKSSTARAVAEALGFRHLDSGAFYRALTWAAMHRKVPVADWPRLDSAALDAFGVDAVPAGSGFLLRVRGRDVSAEIRTPQVTANVSTMARVPAVREWLLARLRHAATLADLVADGRDIGTVVFPAAELKIFLVAEPATRAERRLRQMHLPVTGEAVAEEARRIRDRDIADSQREIAPLRPAPDAVHLDTTHLTFDDQVAAIVHLARTRSHPQ
ncbi:MAG: (d)CMP kinase [Gemmatimonadota bacterium]